MQYFNLNGFSNLVKTLNPFKEVFPHRSALGARIYTTSISKKFWDTYKVFSGNIAFNYRPSYGRILHVGILDYFFLGLPLIFSHLAQYTFKKADEYMARGRHALGLSLCFVCGLLGSAFIFLELPKRLIALSLTVILLPVIITVHLATSSKAKYLMDEARSSSNIYQNSGIAVYKLHVYEENANEPVKFDAEGTVFSLDITNPQEREKIKSLFSLNAGQINQHMDEDQSSVRDRLKHFEKLY